MRVLILAALLPLAACNFGWSNQEAERGEAGSGSGASRSWSVRDFDAVMLRGPDDVQVRVGGDFSITATGDPEVLDRLRLENEGGMLRIGRVGGGSGQQGARIAITLPRIDRAVVNGSGNLSVDRVQGATFTGDLAGSGDLSVGTLAVEGLDFRIAGSGDITAAGTAKRLEVSIAGAGDVDAAGLRAVSAEVSIAGSGNVRAAVDGPAKVSILGSGDVDLGPRAKCTVSKLGSGDVRCGS